LKKVIPITLLLLFFLNQAGYLISFLVQEYQAEEAIKRQLLSTIPESSLDVIDADINKDDIEWEDEGREFYLHGQMYDVAYIKNVNGKTLIYCLNDTKEEDLFKNFSKNITGADDKSQNGQHTVKYQVPDYLLFSTIFIATSQDVRQKHFGYTVALVTAINDINTPPPDLL
jgi:hypothetical protein